jgi:hypothetical protein
VSKRAPLRWTSVELAAQLVATHHTRDHEAQNRARQCPNDERPNEDFRLRELEPQNLDARHTRGRILAETRAHTDADNPDQQPGDRNEKGAAENENPGAAWHGRGWYLPRACLCALCGDRSVDGDGWQADHVIPSAREGRLASVDLRGRGSFLPRATPGERPSTPREKNSPHGAG